MRKALLALAAIISFAASAYFFLSLMSYYRLAAALDYYNRNYRDEHLQNLMLICIVGAITFFAAGTILTGWLVVSVARKKKNVKDGGSSEPPPPPLFN